MILILTYVVKIMVLSDFQQVLAVVLHLLKNYLQSVNNFPALHEKGNPDRETDWTD